MTKIDLTKAKTTTMDTMTKARKVTPIVVVACLLSLASLGWTTWSLLDLLQVGAIGLTVAATADLIWASVIYCEYKGIGHRGWVKFIGWVAVIIVGGFIAGHGVTRGNVAMAVAGPFLTLGTKAVWELALISVKDPSAITPQMQAELDRDLQQSNFEAEKKRIEGHKTVAALEADSLKRVAEIEGDARIKIAELESKRKVFEAQRAFEDRMEAMGSSYKLIRVDDAMVIPGQTQQPQIPLASVPNAEILPPPVVPAPAQPVVTRSQPATTTPPGMVSATIDGDGLTPAQLGRKRLAAAYYLAESAARARGETLSQSKFALSVGENKAQVSRSTKEFPPDSITDAEYAEVDKEGYKSESA